MIELDSGDEMHTIRSAGRVFRVSERTIRRWIAAAGVPVIQGYVSYLALAEAEHAAAEREKSARFAACP